MSLHPKITYSNSLGEITINSVYHRHSQIKQLIHTRPEIVDLDSWIEFLKGNNLFHFVTNEYILIKDPNLAYAVKIISKLVSQYLVAKMSTRITRHDKCFPLLRKRFQNLRFCQKILAISTLIFIALLLVFAFLSIIYLKLNF